MEKKWIILSIFFLVLLTFNVNADITVSTIDNGDTDFGTDANMLRHCTTSDGGTILLEYDYDINGNEAIYFYKFDQNYNPIVNKQLVYTFSDKESYIDSKIVCDGNNAFLVTSLILGADYVTLEGKKYPFNFIGRSDLQVIKFDSSGNSNVLYRTSKNYIISSIDAYAKDYLQVTSSTLEEDFENVYSYGTFNLPDENKFDLRYFRFDKSTGSVLNDGVVVFSDIITGGSIAGDSSNEIYVLDSRTDTNNYGNTYFTKLDLNGNIILSPIKVNTGYTYYPYEDRSSDYNDILMDSSGNLHAFWWEFDSSEEIWQLVYSKLSSTGTFITNPGYLTEHVKNYDRMSVIPSIENDVIDVYYGVEKDYYDDPVYEGIDTSVGWFEIDAQTSSVDDYMYDMFDDTYKLIGSSCPGGNCDPVPPGPTTLGSGSGSSAIPEFSSIGIIFIAIVFVITIVLYKRREIKK